MDVFTASPAGYPALAVTGRLSGLFHRPQRNVVNRPVRMAQAQVQGLPDLALRQAAQLQRLAADHGHAFDIHDLVPGVDTATCGRRVRGHAMDRDALDGGRVVRKRGGASNQRCLPPRRSPPE